MNAKQEWLGCNRTLQIVIESSDGPIEPPWMNPDAAFMRVHSWRESAFHIALRDGVETSPLELAS